MAAESLGGALLATPAAHGGCEQAALPALGRTRQRAVSPRFLLSTWLLCSPGSCQEQRGEGERRMDGQQLSAEPTLHRRAEQVPRGVCQLRTRHARSYSSDPIPSPLACSSSRLHAGAPSFLRSKEIKLLDHAKPEEYGC